MWKERKSLGKLIEVLGNTQKWVDSQEKIRQDAFTPNVAWLSEPTKPTPPLEKAKAGSSGGPSHSWGSFH